MDDRNETSVCSNSTADVGPKVGDDGPTVDDDDDQKIDYDPRIDDDPKVNATKGDEDDNDRKTSSDRGSGEISIRQSDLPSFKDPVRELSGTATSVIPSAFVLASDSAQGNCMDIETMVGTKNVNDSIVMEEEEEGVDAIDSPTEVRDISSLQHPSAGTAIDNIITHGICNGVFSLPGEHLSQEGTGSSSSLGFETEVMSPVSARLVATAYAVLDTSSTEERNNRKTNDKSKHSETLPKYGFIGKVFPIKATPLRISFSLLAVLLIITLVTIRILDCWDGTCNSGRKKLENNRSKQADDLESNTAANSSATPSSSTDQMIAFTTRTELETAVDDYMSFQLGNDTMQMTKLITHYGPMERWNVSAITDFRSLFSMDRAPHVSTNFNENISNWDVSSALDMSFMFLNCTKFNGDLSKWNVSSVSSMNGMFAGASRFNADLSKWDVRFVTSMMNMFQSAENFNADLSKWNVRNVYTTANMFADAKNFNADLSQWDASNFVDTSGMFETAGKFHSKLHFWNVSSVVQMRSMFKGASNFDSDVSLWNVSSVTDMSFMFSEATKFNTNVSIWDTRNVADMSSLFESATSFEGHGVEHWNVGNVVKLSNIFANTQVFDADLSKWNVSNVGVMCSAFAYAKMFRGIGLDQWDVRKAQNIHSVFQGATLFDANLSSWNVANANDLSSLFENTAAFQGIGVENWQVQDTAGIFHMFCNATGMTPATQNNIQSSWTNVRFLDEAFC